MTGNYQSDRLEGEFGIYRQLNGGNYYMSAEHVQNSKTTTFLSVKLFHEVRPYRKFMLQRTTKRK